MIQHDPVGFIIFLLLGALALGAAELYDYARRNW